MEVGSGGLVTCGMTGVSDKGGRVSPYLTILTFPSDSTLRKSSHNVAMRDIVLKHITSLRAEYDEIPDSEFEPIRLEPAFDQAFGTWKVRLTTKHQDYSLMLSTGKVSRETPRRHPSRLAV